MKQLFLPAILLIAGLSGCVDDEAAAPVAEAPAPELLRHDLHTTIDVGWLVGVGAPQSPGILYILSSNGGGFELGDGASVKATAEWTCAAPPCEMAFKLWQGSDVVAEATGTSPLELAVDSAEGGSWAASLTATSATADVAGQLSVQAFWLAPANATADGAPRAASL